jgi:hypothetical protein
MPLLPLLFDDIELSPRGTADDAASALRAAATARHCPRGPANSPVTVTVRGCIGPDGLAGRSNGQRFAMYIVISMPNRSSIAQGVSHFMSISFEPPNGAALRAPRW